MLLIALALVVDDDASVTGIPNSSVSLEDDPDVPPP